MKRSHRKTHAPIKHLWPWAVVFVLASMSGIALFAADTAWFFKPSTAPEEADVVVYKRPNCGCCNLWVEHLRDSGLSVNVIGVDSTESVQKRLGVPEKLGACHTAQAGDYWIEGHVPADLIVQLLAEKPDDIRGLAVPGMPVGSPGMEGPNPVNYSVLSVDTAEETHVYEKRKGLSSLP